MGFIKRHNYHICASSGCGGTLQGAIQLPKGRLGFLAGQGGPLFTVAFGASLQYVVTRSGMEVVPGDDYGNRPEQYRFTVMDGDLPGSETLLLGCNPFDGSIWTAGDVVAGMHYGCFKQVSGTGVGAVTGRCLAGDLQHEFAPMSILRRMELCS